MMKIITLMLMPFLIWMVIGGKQLKRDYGVEDDSDFLGTLIWMYVLVTVIILAIMDVFFDKRF